MFFCKNCRQMRNDCDRLGSGCYGCTRRAAPVDSKMVKSQPKETPQRPCGGCGKFIRPGEGQMLKSNNNIVFCWDCLNSGKWLDWMRTHGNPTQEHEHEKKGTHFGKG